MRLYINYYENSIVNPDVLRSAELVGIIARTITRDFLSSGIAFALVVQHGSAYVGGKNKAHELGAGYLFMKEMGGTILDFEGKDIGEQIYDFNATKSMIAAVNLGIAKEILEEIKKVK